jgi:uncharacterized GH25 family protein
MSPMPSSPSLKRIVLGLFLNGAVLLFAHYTWLSPVPSTAKVGETVTVLLANGHAFPTSEEPVKGVELKIAVFDPFGKSTALTAADKGRGPEAAFKVETEGVYRVASEYDRGVISRTPEGWKPGGKSKYPNATSVLKAYNSFLCTVGTVAASTGSSGPLGLIFEVSWTREGRKLIVLATARNKPVEGAEISAVIGSGEAKPMGATDVAGRIAFEIPEAFKGPILLIGSISKPMPAGSDYDAERTSSSCFLTWE